MEKKKKKKREEGISTDQQKFQRSFITPKLVLTPQKTETMMDGAGPKMWLGLCGLTNHSVNLVLYLYVTMYVCMSLS